MEKEKGSARLLTRKGKEKEKKESTRDRIALYL